MEPQFAWHEDVEVAPHRILRVPFGGSGRPLELTESVIVEADGRAVFVLLRLDPDQQTVLGAFDLESGAFLPDRSGLRVEAPSALRLSDDGLLAALVPQYPQGTVFVRDAATGNLVREIPRAQGRSALALGTVDGRSAVFAPIPPWARDAGALAWDVATGEPIADYPALPEEYLASDFFVEHDGRMLVMGNQPGGAMRFFDALTGAAFGAPFHNHSNGRAEWLAAVSYEGRLIVASRQNYFQAHPILLWDAETGADVLTPPVLTDESLSSLRTESMALVDGRPLLLLGHDADAGPRLTLWDPVAGCEVLPDFFAGYDGKPHTVMLGTLDSGFYAVVVSSRPSETTLWVFSPDSERRGTRLASSGSRIALGRVDGRPTVALAGDGGSLQLFDVATAQERPSAFYGGSLHEGVGHTLAAGTVDGRAVVMIPGTPTRVWDPVDGVPAARLDRFTDVRQGLALGRLDGHDVLAVVTEAGLTVWDFAAGAARTEINSGFEPQNGVVFTEIDGRTVVTAHVADRHRVPHSLRSWDAGTGEPAGRPYPLSDGRVRLTAGHVGDRPVVFVGTSKGPIRVVDPATGDDVLPPLTGHDRDVEALTSGSFDGRAVLVSGGRDHTVRVWDVHTGEPIGEPFNGHGAKILSVHLTEYHGEPVVVSTAERGAPRMWTLRAAPIDPGHTGQISALAGGFWAGAPVFASGAHDMTVRLWDVTTGRQVGAPLTGHRGPVSGIAFVGPDQDILVTADATGQMLRWSAHPDGPRAQPLTRLDGGAFGLATTVFDGREILGAASGDDRVELVDATSGQPYATLHTGTGIHHLDLGVLDSRLVALVVSPHHEYDQGRVTVWDVRSGEPLHPPVVVPEESAGLGAFGMLDGRLVIVQGVDVEDEDEGDFQWHESAYQSVYDAATREILGHITPDSRFNNALVVVGAVALIGSSDGPEQGVFVADLRTGEEIGRLYRGHGSAGVYQVATLEVDGRVLVASSDAGNAVHIWDLEDRTRRLV